MASRLSCRSAVRSVPSGAPSLAPRMFGRPIRWPPLRLEPIVGWGNQDLTILTCHALHGASCHHSPAKSHRCRDGRMMCAEGASKGALLERKSKRPRRRSKFLVSRLRVGGSAWAAATSDNAPGRHTSDPAGTGTSSDRDESTDVFSVMGTTGAEDGARSAPRLVSGYPCLVLMVPLAVAPAIRRTYM